MKSCNTRSERRPRPQATVLPERGGFEDHQVILFCKLGEGPGMRERSRWRIHVVPNVGTRGARLEQAGYAVEVDDRARVSFVKHAHPLRGANSVARAVIALSENEHSEDDGSGDRHTSRQTTGVARAS